MEWLIKPDLWSNHDQHEAAMEGWIIMCDIRPGETHIVKLNNQVQAGLDTGVVRPFTSDLQAQEFVMERMHQALLAQSNKLTLSGRDAYGKSVETTNIQYVNRAVQGDWRMGQAGPSPWVIQPKLWSRWDNQRAMTPGWVINLNGAILRSLVHDRKTNETREMRFQTNEEAEAFVCRLADQGSKFHMRALVARTRAKLNQEDRRVTSYGDHHLLNVNTPYSQSFKRQP